MGADIFVIAIIAFSAYIGYKKGFVKTVSRLCCLIISVITAKILNPFIADFVRESFVGNFISEKFAEQSDEFMGAANMPSFIQQAEQYTVDSLTDAAVGIVSALLIVIVTFFVANFIVNALNVVAKFPLISTINRLCGMAAGFVLGVFMVYLVISLAVVADMQSTENLLEDSVIAYTMYRENILMNLIF